MRIVELQVENIKRIKAVRITPKAGVTIIGGNNGAGKTSVLDTIEWTIGGAKAIQEDPIRHGATKAFGFVDLGEITAERKISSKGTSLTVRDAEGVKQSSPQVILDKLYNKLTFDPLVFQRMAPAKQDEILKKLMGLNFDKLDKNRADLYARRAEISRTQKQLKARADGMAEHADAPDEEVSVAELMEELSKREEDEASSAALSVTVNGLKHDIEEMRCRLSEHEAEARRLKLNIKDRGDEERVASDALDAFTYDAPQDIRNQLTTVEATNRKVRENADRALAIEKAKEATVSSQRLTSSIEGIDSRKAEALENAESPVPGLGFSELGPTLDGVPLNQASSAQQMRLSVAIGLALNPKLRVLLIRDGSLLDDKSMLLLNEIAEENNAHFWIERVGDKDESAVIIEDGEVRQEAIAAQ